MFIDIFINVSFMAIQFLAHQGQIVIILWPSSFVIHKLSTFQSFSHKPKKEMELSLANVLLYFDLWLWFLFYMYFWNSVWLLLSIMVSDWKNFQISSSHVQNFHFLCGSEIQHGCQCRTIYLNENLLENKLIIFSETTNLVEPKLYVNLSFFTKKIICCVHRKSKITPLMPRG